MKAFVTSVGERTTKICKEQLEKYGFDVIVLDGKEKWSDKYKKFLTVSRGESCIKVDADIVVNGRIHDFAKECERLETYLMVQAKGWDFYKNDVGVIGVVYYRKGVQELILNNFDNIDHNRPEATAWRLPEINKYTFTSEWIVGIHGLGQDEETMVRAERNKISRRQMSEYDFELAYKLMEL